jgi:uncharacterized membrane protein
MKERTMNRLCNFATSVGFGAGLMYFFDPIVGKRRRSLLIDQFNHALHKVNDAADTTLRDVSNRTYGTIAEMRGNFFVDDDVSDDVVVSRARSKMGRYVSHPAAVEIAAHNGIVTLGGPILAHEVDHLLCAAKTVRGVRDIVNRLDVHETAENFPALQGGRSRRGEPAELNQAYWTPTTRVTLGGLGTMLMLNCAIKRTPTAILFGTGGFFMFLRALTNLEAKRLLGIRGRRGIDIQKTITIDRPVEDVFNLLADPHRYPEFTDSVSSTKDLGQGRIQKTMVGPAGAELTLTERITRREPNEFVAKRSEPDSPIQYAIRMWFIPQGDSRTKVQIQATYNPPGGVLTHAAASIAGFDFKTVLDDIMLRAKSYLETGVAPHDAARRQTGDGRRREQAGVTSGSNEASRFAE